MRVSECEVLVVGGGPAGLTAAALLADRGVDVLAVERRGGPTEHPRARGINLRGMEVLRGLGLQQQVVEAGRPLERSDRMVFLQRLVGPELRSTPGSAFASAERLAAVSPCGNTQCAQDALEPLLAGRARAAGAEVRYGSRVEDVAVDAGGAVVTVVAADGTPEEVRARFVVAADGARGGVRGALGVPLVGHRVLEHYVGLHVRADLADVVRGREFVLAIVIDPELDGVFAAVDNAERWIFNVPYDPATADVADLAGEGGLALFRRAVGLPEDDPRMRGARLLSAQPWESAVGVAERFRHGPVLLVGDAAHLVPPSGGFGLNSAVADAHGLAWKLAWVLRHGVDERLLDTHEAERRTAALVVTAQAARETEAPEFDSDVRRHGGLDPLEVVVGLRYRSAAVVEESGGDDGAPVGLPDGRPGLRVPHVWVRPGTSTLDLLGPGLTVLAAGGAGAWRAAGESLRVPVAVQDVDPAVLGPVAGVEPGGALVVRPDGYVLWRARTAAAAGELARVVAGVTG